MNDTKGIQKLQNYLIYHIVKLEPSDIIKYNRIVTPFEQSREYKSNQKKMVESIFEKIRKDNFKHLPSRDNALFVSKSKEDALEWALYMLKEDCHFVCLELSACGDIFWGNAEWFDMCYEKGQKNPTFITHDYTQEECAKNYWGNIQYKSIFEEGLFYGICKIKKTERYQIHNRTITSIEH